MCWQESRERGIFHRQPSRRGSHFLVTSPHAVREPRAVMREFGFEPPEGVEVVIYDSTADVRYMVLPMRLSGTEHLDEEALVRLVTRDCLVGANVPRAPIYPNSADA